jgi:mono/diheme cytochrome c family protein
MQRGAAIYRDQCASCHRADGSGAPTEFPPLDGDALVQSRNPTTVLRFILSGTETVATSARPTPFGMPTFAWKLSDREIADVATYVRNTWGNAATAVSPGQVGALRRKVAARVDRPPPSGA